MSKRREISTAGGDVGAPRRPDEPPVALGADGARARSARRRRRRAATAASPGRRARPAAASSRPAPRARPASSTKLKNVCGRSSGRQRAERGLGQHLGGRDGARRRQAAGTWQPSKWSSTSPQACISAYAVVGPTNRKPCLLERLRQRLRLGRRRPARRRACAGAAAAGRARSDQISSASGTSSAARALAIAASIFARLRTIPRVGHQPRHVLLAERGHRLEDRSPRTRPGSPRACAGS